jgi:hypothetical protein
VFDRGRVDAAASQTLPAGLRPGLSRSEEPRRRFNSGPRKGTNTDARLRRVAVVVSPSYVDPVVRRAASRREFGSARHPR